MAAMDIKDIEDRLGRIEALLASLVAALAEGEGDDGGSALVTDMDGGLHRVGDDDHAETLDD